MASIQGMDPQLYVPRQLLDAANEAVQRLKSKLDETTQTGRLEMDQALRSMQMYGPFPYGRSGNYL